MKNPLAILVLAIGLAGAAQAQSTDTEAKAAQQALQTTMGAKAKDLTVTVANGVATLKGWAQQPSDVEQARYIVGQTAGVTQAQSSQVHTWNTTNR